MKRGRRLNFKNKEQYHNQVTALAIVIGTYRNWPPVVKTIRERDTFRDTRLTFK